MREKECVCVCVCVCVYVCVQMEGEGVPVGRKDIEGIDALLKMLDLKGHGKLLKSFKQRMTLR